MQAHNNSTGSNLCSKNRLQIDAGQQPPSEDDDEDGDQETKTLSEATLSPAGFSSIGSPTGSLASPLTPQELRSTWYYPSVVGLGAFKPPTSLGAAATSMTSKRSHDPRDAKHPLSICQLTGNASLSSASPSSSSLAAAICAASAMATSASLFGLRWRRFRSLRGKTHERTIWSDLIRRWHRIPMGQQEKKYVSVISLIVLASPRCHRHDNMRHFRNKGSI